MVHGEVGSAEDGGPESLGCSLPRLLPGQGLFRAGTQVATGFARPKGNLPDRHVDR